MTHFFQQLRRRSSADTGLLDIMSLLVGVLIAGILAGVISVSLMQLIPFTQDEAAKHSLRAVSVAQSTARITNGGSYLTLAELESRDLLRNTDGKELKVESDGRTFSACITSASGAAFEIDSARIEPRRTTAGPCAETPVTPPVEATEPWVIPDAALRANVVMALGRPAGAALIMGDAPLLTLLHNSNPEITSAEGLQHAVNLRTLSFDLTHLNDVAPLAGLGKLEVLSLSRTQVVDISELGGLVNMVRLSVDRTGISDLTVVAHMPKLQILEAYDTPIASLNALAGHPSLWRLHVDKTAVTSLAPLAGVPLKDLTLDGTEIVDWVRLAEIPTLENLYVSDSNFADAAPLADLTSLQALEARNTLLTDIAPLAALSELQMVDLTGCAVTDWAPLAHVEDVVGRPWNWDQGI